MNKDKDNRGKAPGSEILLLVAETHLHHLTQKGGSVNIVGEKVSLERGQSETDTAWSRAEPKSEETEAETERGRVNPHHRPGRVGSGYENTAGAKCGSSELDHTLSPDE